MVAVWLKLVLWPSPLVQVLLVVVAGSCRRRPWHLVLLWPTRPPTPLLSHPVPALLRQGPRLVLAVAFQSMIAYTGARTSPRCRPPASVQTLIYTGSSRPLLNRPSVKKKNTSRTLWAAMVGGALPEPLPPPQPQLLTELLPRPSQRPPHRAGQVWCLMGTTSHSGSTLHLGPGAEEQEVSGRGRKRTGANRAGNCWLRMR